MGVVPVLLLPHHSKTLRRYWMCRGWENLASWTLHLQVSCIRCVICSSFPPLCFTLFNFSYTTLHWIFFCLLPLQSTTLQFKRRVAEDPLPDLSHSAQISAIESSFTSSASSTTDLSKLKHPTKPHLKAVDSFEVLPDIRIWANAYDLVKFSERPGDRGVEVSLSPLVSHFTSCEGDDHSTTKYRKPTPD